MSLVSYASFPVKALSVPFGDNVFVQADDFVLFHGGEPEEKTQIRLSRSRSELFLEVTCFESKEIRAQNTRDDWTVFSHGDHLEIFFGMLEPFAWNRQFVIGAGGGRADSFGGVDQWKGQTETSSGFWKAKLVFPFSLFRMNNLTLGFNVCRVAEARGEISTWCPLKLRFHETENYGLLVLDDYSKVYFAETGTYPEKEFSRAEFETAVNSLRIPANSIQHGPWISNPSETGMTITFASAGRCGAFLDYSVRGSQTWQRLPFECGNGILFQNRTIHTIHLQNLIPGMRYQYRICLLSPERMSPVYEFTTSDSRKKEFQFTLSSDIHSDVDTLRQILRLESLKESDFLMNLGDYLSCACGSDSYYTGILDEESKWYHRTGKNLLFVRGNHEQVGMDAALFQELFPRPDGKYYCTFRHGPVFFIMLDAGNDKPDDPAGIFHNAAMLEEQREWLRGLIHDPEYRHSRWRIVLSHHPPAWDNNNYDSRAAESLFQVLFSAEIKPDLILCGHLHKYLKILPGTGTYNYLRRGIEQKALIDFPCPLLANDVDTVIHAHIRMDELQLELIRKDGKIIDKLKCRRKEEKQ